jgi:hypothetical protein
MSKISHRSRQDLAGHGKGAGFIKILAAKDTANQRKK